MHAPRTFSPCPILVVGRLLRIGGGHRLPTDRNVIFILTKSWWGKHEAHVSRTLHNYSTLIDVSGLDGLTVVGYGDFGCCIEPQRYAWYWFVRGTCVFFQADTPGGHLYLYMVLFSRIRACVSGMRLRALCASE